MSGDLDATICFIDSFGLIGREELSAFGFDQTVNVYDPEDNFDIDVEPFDVIIIDCIDAMGWYCKSHEETQQYERCIGELLMQWRKSKKIIIVGSSNARVSFSSNFQAKT